MLKAATWATALLAGSASALGDPFRLLGSSFGTPGDNATYDYVVVGGGTAGLTIAARLVEQHAGTVAVVEAGTFYELSNSNNSMLPGGDGAFTGKGVTDFQPLIDWGYITEPQAVSDLDYNSTLELYRVLILSLGRQRLEAALRGGQDIRRKLS